MTYRLIITVDTDGQAEDILDVLREAEEEGDINFPFEVQREED